MLDFVFPLKKIILIAVALILFDVDACNDYLYFSALVQSGLQARGEFACEASPPKYSPIPWSCNRKEAPNVNY